MTDPRAERAWDRVPAAAVALVAVASLLLLGVNALRGATACAWDTSECAYSAQKAGYYQGSFVISGDPRTVELQFGSRRGLPPIPLRLDAAGRYCVVWANERYAEAATTQDQERFASNGYQSAPLAEWHSFGTSGPPAGCQQVATDVRWDHQDGVERAWQFLTLIGIAVLGLGLLLFARVARPAGLFAFSAAVLALVTNAALSFTIWT